MVNFQPQLGNEQLTPVNQLVQEKPDLVRAMLEYIGQVRPETALEHLHRLTALHRDGRGQHLLDDVQLDEVRGAAATDVIKRLQETENRASEDRELDYVQGLTFNQIPEKEITWLWSGFMAAGTVVTLDGDPGQGKSTVMLDIAARVSTGQPMPGCDERRTPASIIIMSAEDDSESKIGPVLRLAGADKARIVNQPMKLDYDGPPTMITVKDIDILRREIVRTDAKLVIVDPLTGYLPSSRETDSHKDQDIRKVLGPLSQLANETSVCIVGIRHLNKTGGSNPLYRGGGSIAIGGGARTVIMAGAERDDETRHVLAVAKSNVGPRLPSITYYIETVPDDLGKLPRIRWGERGGYRAKELFAEPTPTSRLDEAKSFLEDHVLASDHEQPATQLFRDAARQGITERTLRRAMSGMPEIAAKQRTKQWCWGTREQHEKAAQMAKS